LFAQPRRHFAEADLLELGVAMAVICGMPPRTLQSSKSFLVVKIPPLPWRQPNTHWRNA